MKRHPSVSSHSIPTFLVFLPLYVPFFSRVYSQLIFCAPADAGTYTHLPEKEETTFTESPPKRERERASPRCEGETINVPYSEAVGLTGDVFRLLLVTQNIERWLRGVFFLFI